MTKVSARKGPLITKKMIKISIDDTETDDENVKEMFKKLKDLIESKEFLLTSWLFCAFNYLEKIIFERYKQIEWW